MSTRGARVAVIGAGVTGLVAAHRLAQAGHQPVVFERWPGLGGQAATFDVGEGHLLERYYHHWFTSDRHIVALCEELDQEVEWRPSSMAFFAAGAQHSFTTPLDLLRFKPLPLASRLRMGLAVVVLQRRGGGAERYESETAREWIMRAMGRRAYENVWGPLLRGKFGDRADDISMAWLWSKLTLRRQIAGEEARSELLGYPASSFEGLFAELARRIKASGGAVHIDRPVASIARAGSGFELTPAPPGSFRRGHDPRDFEAAAAPERFDSVLATVPSDIFAALLDPGLAEEVGDGYLGRLRSISYHTALCLLLELDRPFSRFYWTNVADTSIPFVGLIEHTNFVDPSHYGGRRFLYLANYVAPDDPLLELDPDALLEAYTAGLRRVNPAFERGWVRNRWRFAEPAAQPIVDVGYRERIPPMQTGARGLFLANTTQIYPEDRGTNYSVRLGDDAAGAVAAAAGPVTDAGGAALRADAN